MGASTARGFGEPENPPEAWSHHYAKKISFKLSQKLATQTSAILFEQAQTQPFNQLIFSWNALPEPQGHLFFSVQPRLAKTQEWSTRWYPMFVWGNTQNRSFQTQEPGDPMQYQFVHLDGVDQQYADGFRIKVEAIDGAHLENIRFVHACTCDFAKFQNEIARKIYKKLPSLSLKGVPAYSQFEIEDPENKSMCSPTSTCMLTSFLLKRLLDPHAFALNSIE